MDDLNAKITNQHWTDNMKNTRIFNFNIDLGYNFKRRLFLINYYYFKIKINYEHIKKFKLSHNIPF